MIRPKCLFCGDVWERDARGPQPRRCPPCQGVTLPLVIPKPQKGTRVKIVPASAEWRALHRRLTTTEVKCREDPDMWTSNDPQQRQAAVKLCARCPLRAPCHAAAVSSKEKFGVWGGRDMTVETREVN